MGGRYRNVLVFFFVAVFGLAACGKTPSARFYTLSSPAGPGAGGGEDADGSRQVVGIGPVSLAKYLDQPAMVIRSGPTTLQRSELHRWGGPLEGEVARVLVENMRNLLPGQQYLVLPWLDAGAQDLRVQLNVTRFEGNADGTVVLNAAWMLFTGDGKIPVASGDVALTEPVSGSSYAAVSQAMSRTLFTLCRSIAKTIIEN